MELSLLPPARVSCLGRSRLLAAGQTLASADEIPNELFNEKYLHFPCSPAGSTAQVLSQRCHLSLAPCWRRGGQEHLFPSWLPSSLVGAMSWLVDILVWHGACSSNTLSPASLL